MHGEYHGAEPGRGLETATADSGCGERSFDGSRRAREILRAALSGDEALVHNLGTAIHELFKPYGGVDPFIPPREPMRDPPQFD